MIGRETEKTKLLEAFNSDNSEFVAVYGRRRVGKTYLIRETFNNLFVFQHSGLANATMKDQLAAWVDDIREAGLDVKKVPQSWLDAFRLLKELIKVSKNRKKVVFIDEMLLQARVVDIPRICGVIEQRGTAAPAVGVTVGILLYPEEQATLFEIFNNLGVGLFEPQTSQEGSIFAEMSIGLYGMDDGQIILASHV